MSAKPPAKGTLAGTFGTAPALGFVPVAVHFQLFETLVKFNRPVSSTEIVEAVGQNVDITSPLNEQLADDTLYIMTGLGLIDMVNGKYEANDITKHMIEFPSAIQGALHFTTEVLMAAAFVYPKLIETNFAYPWKDNSAAFQFAYEKMGNTKYANQHIFATMYDQGRMPSFNFFMEGKFGSSTKMPARVRSLGYPHLDKLMLDDNNPVIVVDVGGGQGQMLLELKEAYPHLKAENLILQEFNGAANPRAGITATDWDFKSSTPQPVLGATIYNFMRVFHNTSDIESIKCLKKIAKAMSPTSRIFIQETAKVTGRAKMHAAMIALFAGRERSFKEWRDIADIAGLKVTFEKDGENGGDGLIEMMKM